MHGFFLDRPSPALGNSRLIVERVKVIGSEDPAFESQFHHLVSRYDLDLQSRTSVP